MKDNLFIGIGLICFGLFIMFMLTLVLGSALSWEEQYKNMEGKRVVIDSDTLTIIDSGERTGILPDQAGELKLSNGQTISIELAKKVVIP